ncbi:voltage-dependent anion-selective channel protein 3-like [Balaenoptera musculus]|uniref:Non-selective voltage-gated ion channel VDAC3 n=1 Tax=Balaenoptera musculus TaxID=9771 RepID=A0A8B8WEP6_BALMU|nr:voltage-dependent anion-selective channel protein 3-like [Balaenoptera musculus]
MGREKLDPPSKLSSLIARHTAVHSLGSLADQHEKYHWHPGMRAEQWNQRQRGSDILGKKKTPPTSSNIYNFSGPTIYGWAVWAIEGWLAGYQASFDTAKPKLSQNNFALGYKAADFQLHTHVSDSTESGEAIYQKVNKKTETSINLAWTAGRNNTCSGISAKYQLDCRTSLSAEVNNASLIGPGYPQTLRPGVKLTLSALICGKNFNAGGHKVGLGFELEAYCGFE